MEGDAVPLPARRAAAAAASLACAAPAPRRRDRRQRDARPDRARPASKAQRLGRRLGARLGELGRTSSRRAAHYTAARRRRLQPPVAALKARGVKVLVVVAPLAGVGLGRAGGHRAAGRPGDVRRASWAGSRSACPASTRGSCGTSPTSPSSGSPARPTRRATRRCCGPRTRRSRPRGRSDVVVTGGLIGNDMDFVAALYAHGARGSFDAVGVHTDTACLTDGPGRYYRDERGRIGRYTFSGYREVHAVMADHGDGAKPIWMTEIGWNTQSTRPRSCNVGPLGGAEAARRRPAAPGALPARRLSLPRRGPVRRRRVLVRDAGHPGRALRARLRALPPRGQGQARRARVPAAAARGIRPRRCGGVVDRTPPTIARAQPARRPRASAASSRVRVRARRQPRRHRAAADLSSPLDGQHVRTWGGRGGSIDPWWGSADWRPGAAHAHVPRPRRRVQRDEAVTVRETGAGSVQALTPARRRAAALPMTREAMRSRLVTSLSSQPPPSPFAAAPAAAVETGVNETLHQTKPTGQTAAELGAGWVRLWATWEAAEPAPGALAARHDRHAQRARSPHAKARGLKVLMVVHRSPAWAVGRPAAAIAPPDRPGDVRRGDGRVRRAACPASTPGSCGTRRTRRLLGRRRRPGEVRGDGQGGLSGDQGASSRTTSS